MKLVESAKPESVVKWVIKHLETLKSLFVDYCGDTGTEPTEDNFAEFAYGMFFQCKH